ncbi:hypothetical protein H5407_18155 [Mitsuaria sp. WAJ17]|uniref:hypothetical protein n=1 Tax=Mitsuaria sp. WAJ17 TaxID=2761452 RepID=UPI001601AB4C|nr:hypothetical protein [Mitsuaria sp. WAJ17]MBB2487159.1 hypothetical protein [Mitsuaria sp. WAJ17]
MAKIKSAYRQVGALSLGVVAALLTACGGGGGSTGDNGGSTTGPVVSSQAGPVSVTLPTYGGYEYWMAYQDGDGPWKAATRSADGFSFQVEDKAGKYAVMLVQEANSPRTADLPPSVLAYHLTRAESANIDLRPLPDSRTDYMTVQFTQQGAPASGTCAVALGSRASTSGGCDTLASRRLSVPMARMDAFAVHLNDSGAADALVIQRDLDMRSITALNFDFTKAVALPAPSQTSALTGYVPIAGETLSRMASLVSRSGQIRLALGSQTTLAYPLVPAGALRSDDTYVVSATARMVQGTVTARRSASYQSAVGAAQPLTLPPYAGPLALGGSAARPTMTWTPVTGSTLTDIFALDLSGLGPTIDFTFSAGWIGGARTVTYTVPDLTGLGWKPSWNLNRQTRMTVYYTESFTSRPTPAYFAGLPSEKVEDQTSWFTQMSSEVSIP